MTVKRNAALGFIFITILIDVIGFGIIIPVLPSLIKDLTGGNISQAARYGSWLTFAYAVMQFLFSPLVGALSDRFGRRPVLLFALFGLGLDYVFQAFSPTITLLFLGRIIAGITGASFTTATAYIADISTPDKRAQNFGLIGVAFGVGFIIGPAIGALSSKIGAQMDPHLLGSYLVNWKVRLPFIVAAIFSLLNMLYGYFVLPESLLKENRRKIQWKRANPVGSLMHLRKYPIISGLTISFFLLYIAAHAVQSNWTYYTMYRFNWDEFDVGISLSVVGVLIAGVQGGLIRVTMPKFGAKNSVYIGLTLYAIGMLLFAFATKGWMMYVFLVPYCLGGICGPALQGIISNQVPNNEQGELQGALTSLISVTSFLGPLIMNNTFAYFTGKNAPIEFPGAPFVLGAVLVVGSILFAIRSLKAHHLSEQENAKV